MEYYAKPVWYNLLEAKHWLEVYYHIHEVQQKMINNCKISRKMDNFIKIKFADDDSLFIVPNHPQAIVRLMRDTSRFASNESLNDYMKGFVNRYHIDTGSLLRCDNFTNFVEDLLNFGVIELGEKCSCQFDPNSSVTVENNWIIGTCNQCQLPIQVPQMDLHKTLAYYVMRKK